MPRALPFTEVSSPAQQLASSSCELAARYESVRDARAFARDTLHRWRLADLFDNVALVASELVTNALRHGVGTGTGPHPTSLPTSPPVDPVVRLSLAHWTERVVCAVRDPSSRGPVTRAPDHIAESGRGLHLVASCSETWGWHPLAGAGKVVWALFPAPL
ncbi:regulator [Streptantibioticus cattleyicolor NRRL 8057 = DSM 46488]|uniref:Regulator n=1 Tax=Streptantibioticus cattleyicolor (strain ATCC 35852 / DSM 46488 / JCM 4925 / NBRC 14057 / NRRL 8057) TaxID=1003195 RepID=F8JPK9_STREN|nr:regulator [Streptantibioticus cattleyicolor NRRL 8057 = DSM 46488]MYS62198.1 ATP-binding protein [Streptomyces sp. SID5468]CCB78096.1 Regulatory protein [Streptantibioticus cattleyicolor NRRL 8057 = DSM 46488]